MSSSLFRDAYQSILTAVNMHDIAKDHNREVAAYLCFLTFAILDESAPEHIPIKPDQFMYQRISLYAELSQNDLLNNWQCPDIPDLNDNVLFIAFIAFGDLLINRSARTDYRSAVHELHGITETTLFGMTMLKTVLPITNKYIEALIEIKEHPATPTWHISHREPQHQVADSRYRVPPPQDRYPATPSVQPGKATHRRSILPMLLFVIIGVAIGMFFYSQGMDYLPQLVQNIFPSSTATPKPTSTPSATNASSESLLYDQMMSILAAAMNSSAPAPTTTPMYTYNGKMLVVSEYIATCPFSISADSDADYYIYLEYQYHPAHSKESRSLKSTASSPYENDIAFIVKAGKTVSIDVPIGVYKLYYATGKNFYGIKELFGEDTRYYESDEFLSFYLSGNYYNGCSITLWETYDGNFETDEISEKNFPTR